MSNATSVPAVDLLPDFKQAMRRLAATVTIITTRHDGQRHGMAANRRQLGHHGAADPADLR